MSEPQFMPGPWSADVTDEGAFQIEIERGWVLCQRSEWPNYAAASKANGHLIAAAPDIYDALVLALGTLVDVAPEQQDVIQQGQLALAKAEGIAS